MSAESSEPQQPRQEQPPTFDRVIAGKLRDAVRQVILEHPEVRGVTCVVDYRGDLNDAAVAAVWLGETIRLGGDGRVTDPAAVVGSLKQLLRVLAMQMDRAAQAIVDIELRLTRQAAELLAQRREAAGPPADNP